MTEVIGVRFKKVGKVYYFDPNGIQAGENDYVIVETARGLECGEVAMHNREVSDDAIVKPLKKVIRKANSNDLKIMQENAKLEEDAFRICEEKIAKHQLEMKLVAVEYTFDHSKILFYFSADGRIDFRELVKDLASVFRTRIELRQIGVRDESKMIGGLGICGRPLCCTTFLDDFQPVSINMAKEQGLSLNPTKISGTCGRLMCCLKYESDVYKELIRNAPKVDSVVDTPQGRGTVMDVSLLKGCCKVRLFSSPDSPVVLSCEDCCRVHHEKPEDKAANEPVGSAENTDTPADDTADTAFEPASVARPPQEQQRQQMPPRRPRPDKNMQGVRPPRERPQFPDKPRPPADKQFVGTAEADVESSKDRSLSSPRRRHRGSRGGSGRHSAENKKLGGAKPSDHSIQE